MVAELGTIVNVGAILAECLVDILLKGGLSKRPQDTISSAVGLCTAFAGVIGAIQGLTTISSDGFETRDTFMTVVYVVAGAALGKWTNIEYKLEQLGEWCRSRVPGGQKSGTFTKVFASSSLLFCMGAMAIASSLEDGLDYNYSTLSTKAVMNGVLSITFTAVLGIGTALSVLPAGIYQGSMTALTGLVRPCLTELMIARMSCIDSILILGLGLNLVLENKIKIGNLLSAIFPPFLMCLLGF